MAAATMPMAFLSTDRNITKALSISKFRQGSRFNFSLNALPILQQQRGSSRGLLLVSGALFWDALTSSLTGQKSAREASLSVKRGMQLFVQGNVEQSLVEFDRAIELDPRLRACLKKEQPNLDMMLRLIPMILRNQFGVSFVKLNYMVLTKLGDAFLRLVQIQDLSCRKYMQCLKMVVTQMMYALNARGLLIAEFSNGRQHEYFYAALYASLYQEAQSNLAAAEAAMKVACHSPYGLSSDDYMASLAKVHFKRRGWKVEDSSLAEWTSTR